MLFIWHKVEHSACEKLSSEMLTWREVQMYFIALNAYRKVKVVKQIKVILFEGIYFYVLLSDWCLMHDAIEAQNTVS